MANLIIDDIKAQIKSGNPVTRLIIINVTVFLCMAILQLVVVWDLVPERFLSILGDNLAFHTGLYGLALKPWTLITYMFIHHLLFHILWNMVALYWFGNILAEYTSIKKIVPVYLIGGIAGALFATLLIVSFPPFQKFTGYPILGASAAVTAVIAAAAFLVPNLKMNMLLIGPVKLIYVALFIIIINLINVAPDHRLNESLSHLGGALAGYIFTLQYKKGKDITTWLNKMLDSLKKIFSSNPKSKMKTVHRRPISDEKYNEEKVNTQEKVDEILDKISKSGYESLSSKEKEFLFKVSGKK